MLNVDEETSTLHCIDLTYPNAHSHTPTHKHTLLYTALRSQCVCLIFSLAPLPNGEHSWHPEAPRGLNSGLKTASHFRAGTLLPTKHPAFPPFWPTMNHSPLRSLAKDPSVENDLFERWSRSFERGFSSHSVSQRCVFIWISARVPIQECELAEDVIKEMYVLICGLTFKCPCSLSAVCSLLFFLATENTIRISRRDALLFGKCVTYFAHLTLEELSLILKWFLPLMRPRLTFLVLNCCPQPSSQSWLSV